jgi:hypothetical protein
MGHFQFKGPMSEATQETKPATVEVTNLDQFVSILSGWHSNRVQTLEHMLQIPDGTEVEVKNEDGSAQQHIITGDVLVGFKLGLNLSLMELGSLPFVTETAEAPTTGDLKETLSGQVAG